MSRSLFQVDVQILHGILVIHIYRDIYVHAANGVDDIDESVQIQHGCVVDLNAQILLQNPGKLTGRYRNGICLAFVIRPIHVGGKLDVELILVGITRVIGIAGQLHNRDLTRFHIIIDQHNHVRQAGRTIVTDQKEIVHFLPRHVGRGGRGGDIGKIARIRVVRHVPCARRIHRIRRKGGILVRAGDRFIQPHKRGR